MQIQSAVIKIKLGGQGWHMQAQVPNWLGSINGDLGTGPVNADLEPWSVNAGWGPGLVGTGWGPVGAGWGPVGMGWGPGTGGRGCGCPSICNCSRGVWGWLWFPCWHWQSSQFGGAAGPWAIILWDLGTFLMFPNFLRWYVLGSSANRIYHHYSTHASFHLWWK